MAHTKCIEPYPDWHSESYYAGKRCAWCGNLGRKRLKGFLLTCLTLVACGSTPDGELFDETFHQSTGGHSQITGLASGGKLIPIIVSSPIGNGGAIGRGGASSTGGTTTGGTSVDCLKGAGPPAQGQPWTPNCKTDSDCSELCRGRTPVCFGWCECIGTEETQCNAQYPHLTNECYVGCPEHSVCRDGKDCVPP